MLSALKNSHLQLPTGWARSNSKEYVFDKTGIVPAAERVCLCIYMILLPASTVAVAAAIVDVAVIAELLFHINAIAPASKPADQK